MAVIIPVPTAPVSGTSEQQTITKSGTVTAGNGRLVFRNERTSLLPWNATATQIRDALRALNEVQASGVSGVSGGPISTTPAVVTFAGHLAVADLPQMTYENVDLVGGGTYVVTTNVAGVGATLRGYGLGTVVVAEDTGVLYVNLGTADAPSWKRIVAGQSSALVDLTAATGTANDTVQDVGSSFDQTILNNNFKDLATKLNAVLAALRTAGVIAS